ncbi:hypothetical protein CDV36_015423 [Fusarium kuroshium]|uniref:Uncharacterized protein n=1 Tax=Fusarium kuroshium TaxID=2010991 RepID=A0A3M2RAK1_9HYPO|nr:hypothetical protein CDV36_015423 [Fusarium kuroshium]
MAGLDSNGSLLASNVSAVLGAGSDLPKLTAQLRAFDTGVAVGEKETKEVRFPSPSDQGISKFAQVRREKAAAQEGAKVEVDPSPPPTAEPELRPRHLQAHPGPAARFQH